MKYILAIQTAEFPNEICLVKADKNQVVTSSANMISFKEYGQTIEQLKDSVDKLVKDEKVKIDDIDLISVCLGPGSYTGTRGGVAFSKGMGQFSNIPVVGVSAFEVLKENAMNVKNVIYLLDARNERVYYGKDIIDEKQIKVDNVLNVLKDVEGKALLIGSGALKNRNLIKKKLGKNTEFAEAKLCKLNALNVAKAGIKKYSKKPSIYTTGYLLKVKPLYILAPNITKPASR